MASLDRAVVPASLLDRVAGSVPASLLDRAAGSGVRAGGDGGWGEAPGPGSCSATCPATCTVVRGVPLWSRQAGSPAAPAYWACDGAARGFLLGNVNLTG